MIPAEEGITDHGVGSEIHTGDLYRYPTLGIALLYLHLPDLLSPTPGAQLKEFSVFFCKSQDSQVLLNTLKNTKIQKLYSYTLINHLLGIIR